jgi:hypothetical protein
MISVKLHTRTQLDTYLDTLRAGLLNDNDDLNTLSSMPETSWNRYQTCGGLGCANSFKRSISPDFGRAFVSNFDL